MLEGIEKKTGDGLSQGKGREGKGKVGQRIKGSSGTLPVLSPPALTPLLAAVRFGSRRLTRRQGFGWSAASTEGGWCFHQNHPACSKLCSIMAND
ncbi:hypothetical protein M0804_004817 [Polistes exclamans]|nr:hypothetical protein M0804_004817 [Polistes exclamans]